MRILSPMPRRRADSASRGEATDAPLGGLTESALRRLVPARIFERGVGYLESGAVLEAAWRGDELHAAVQGSEMEPYRVVAEARGDRVTAACDCPYGDEWGDWCKHIVAMLLLAVRDAAAIPRLASTRELVARLDRDALARLVETLVELDPELYDEVARAVSGPARPDGV